MAFSISLLAPIIFTFCDYGFLEKPDDGYRYIYFTAKWCGPCQKQSNKDYIESLKKKEGWTVGEKPTDRFQIVDTDSQEGVKLVQKYQVKLIPYVLQVDKDGKQLGEGTHFKEGKGLEELIKRKNK